MGRSWGAKMPGLGISCAEISWVDVVFLHEAIEGSTGHSCFFGGVENVSRVALENAIKIFLLERSEAFLS